MSILQANSFFKALNIPSISNQLLIKNLSGIQSEKKTLLFKSRALKWNKNELLLAGFVIDHFK
ncbi:hypothetical protein B1NLA3E_13500 [Bacillus sp. 1NLA3E]|nr:hypothetical protein B1NLA3E_13500 [Bacillus sp. 1NLA3E]